ncbi:MAG: type II toxin-antitoxin system HicA family toxin [Caldilineaceae bacterium SB0665_bin_25]|nr:type II toxin-antitoxin system HicA family toxin [Caldilineaceae bacterium SB0665_bin_25]
MPRLPPKSFRQVRRVLLDNGFEEKRQSGSHVIFSKRERNEAGETVGLDVVVPRNSDIPVGTLKSIIRQSGLPDSLFR